ncbi:UvrD-helicase domain-containing protein [Pontibacter indicus]|uniref:DNA 3'-5' helicase n=1 Tax=Pontibacter indicus TaxID=1317125 RepID=A0A1R3WPD2_9BACT|nr:UvrD-helicase domain-containing protein [Pontibacter indicus]SIT79657.1 ATP-dependent exoDNAse (exonuclease V) beta subunit (contains helicase and exonuclease domains) [Pontibacter indicus]
MSPNFKILSSSAGSGKTYTLTKEYLKLALHTSDPDYYRSILAITFTNDAAAEMKERILGALRNFNDPNLSEGEREKSEDLLDKIVDELLQRYPGESFDKEQIRQRAGRLFTQILYNYSDFSVSTIDSFVNKIVQAFTKELNIPYNFEVDLDSQTLVTTAVQLLLDKVSNRKDDLLSETLEHYALEKAREGRSWNTLADDLADFAKNLLNEQVYEAVTDLQSLTLEDFREIRQQLKTLQEGILAALQEDAGKALQAIEQAGLAPADFYQGARGLYGYFSKFNREADLTYANNYARQTVEEDKWYAGKASSATKTQIDGIRQLLTDLYYNIESIKEQYAGTFTLISAVVPHLYKVSVLNELEKCLQEIKLDRNTVHISEFNKRIIDIVLKEPVPFIYERLGEKYNHILIDEFQDTSVLQWNNLLPLVDNALASGHFSMVVGDAKQAIYRWRGGEMEQILHLYKNNTHLLYENRRHGHMIRERYESVRENLAPDVLQQNFRSRREIIEFNNKLFTYFSEQHKLYGTFTSIYDEDFVQEAPASGKTGGHVQIMFTYPDDLNYKYDLSCCVRSESLYDNYTHEQELSYDASTLNMVLELVRQGEADGYTLKDMAVLCRTNAKSKLIANFLKEKQYDIISQDSLSLQFAEVINLIIAMFRVFNRPNDTLAKSEALYLIHTVTTGRVPTTELAQTIARISNQTDRQLFFDYLREVGYDVKERETGNLSIYELTEQLIRIFNLLGHNNECEYLFRFLDLVLEYSLKNSNNLNNFLAYWDVQKEKLSINTPKDRNAITITSIHKAKGLAYPIVIVPFADWSTEPQTHALMWSRLSDNNKVMGKLRSVAVNISARLEHTELAKQYNTEIEKTFIENLNMLYVALTRPKDRLYLIGNGKDLLEERKALKALEGTAKNVSHLLHRYLVAENLWEPGKLCYQVYAGEARKQNSGSQEIGPAYALDFLQTNDWAQRLQLKQHANNVFDFETQTEQRIQNKKLHYALSRILTAAQLDDVLRQMVYQGIISDREKLSLKERLLEVVNHPKISHYFSEAVIVEHEKELLDARAYLYKPDRVVFDGDQVVLMEFKLPPPLEEHRNKLDHYAVRFKQLGYEKVKCLLYYFDTEELYEWSYGGKSQQIGLAL